jgi:diguanylate cyclase (GGDEF)-like protein/PAS domain S-box-containing protein
MTLKPESSRKAHCHPIDAGRIESAAGRALSTDDQRLLDVVRQLPVAWLCVDAAGRIAGWNDAAERLFGWPRQQVLGLAAATWLPPTQQARWQALLRLLRHRPERLAALPETDVAVHHRDGHAMTLAITLGASVTADGPVLSAVARDVTTQREAEQAAAVRNRQLQTLSDNLPAMIGYVDADQRFRFVNAAYEKSFLRPLDQILGKTLREVLGSRRYAEVAETVAATLRGEVQHIERLARQRDGSERYFMMDYRPDIAPDGTVRGYFTLATDITERKTAELKLAASERGLRTLMDRLPVLVSYHDRLGRTLICNARHRDWLGLDPDQLIGKPISYSLELSCSLHHAHYFDRAMLGEEVSFETEQSLQGELRHHRTTVLPDRQADGTVVGFFCLTTDQTAQKQVELQLDLLARRDSLTGLPNRRQLEETLQRAVDRSRRARTTLVLMFVDIDHFKLINDSRGHAAGDLVLQSVAQRLRNGVRSTDTVARLAGDEFIVLLEDVQSTDDACEVGTKLLAAVAEPIALDDGPPLRATISVGLAVCISGSMAPAQLLSAADHALYASKKSGRNAMRWSTTTPTGA